MNKKEIKKVITAKTLLQCRILKARKENVNGYDTKTKVQTTTKYNVMHRLEQVSKGIV